MESWLRNLDQHTAVIVPTRSLANVLTEQINIAQMQSGVRVWEAPNILIWQDYMQMLWKANRDQIAKNVGVHSIISSQQALLLWTQVIQKSKRDERALTLLNVQQSAKAVQRSWRLMHDWRIDSQTLKLDHAADTQQFLQWIDAYATQLQSRKLFDEQLLANYLSSQAHHCPYKHLIWYSYDLVTLCQQELNNIAKQQGIQLIFPEAVKVNQQDRQYHEYATQQEELRGVLLAARKLLESEPEITINIVVPQLQHFHTDVRELARELFYPSLSPLQLQQVDTAYRFSLGQVLKEWSAIQAALSVIGLLKNRVKIVELSYLLRNRFLRVTHKLDTECRVFDVWLKRQRLNVISFDRLTELYQQCLEDQERHGVALQQSELLIVLQDLIEQQSAFRAQLSEAKSRSGFASLSFSQWADIINAWLQAWGWSTAVAQSEMSSVQYQLMQRWQALLDEFAGLATVQTTIGLNRALEILQQMSRDAVFLPKSAASPILISGLYEAIGRQVDVCFLTGMIDNYPSAARRDAFVPNRLLERVGYPEASSTSSFKQAQKVIDNLLDGVPRVIISYAQQDEKDRELLNSVSPLFRECEFSAKSSTAEQLISSNVVLQHYEDVQGGAWPSAKKIKGGSAIFENQSNCAFKAFVTHQLKFQRDEDVEFGLDPRDRGNVVHRILERAWAELHTQTQLKQMTIIQLQAFAESTVLQVLNDTSLHLSEEKRTLLALEKPRLTALLCEWLEVDAQRPTEFSVVEREEQRFTEFAGIGFNYIIDRLDILDDGRTVIIDYKTAEVTRSDWLGDRLKRPQLPLYAVALDAIKRQPVAGIAYAKVKKQLCKYESLSESEIFKMSPAFDKQSEQKWVEHRANWSVLLEELAHDFLAGDARVNPIDVKTCEYCELQSICRISQLRQQSNSVTPGVKEYD